MKEAILKENKLKENEEDKNDSQMDDNDLAKTVNKAPRNKGDNRLKNYGSSRVSHHFNAIFYDYKI